MSELKRVIEVTIGFDADKEEVEYVKSDFLDEKYSFKDPTGYTAKLMEMGLAWWIRNRIGIFCPECEAELQEGWSYCPKCGWGNDD